MVTGAVSPVLERLLSLQLIDALVAVGEDDRACRYLQRWWPQHNWKEKQPTLLDVQRYGIQAIRYASIEIRNGRYAAAISNLQTAIAGFDALPADVKNSLEKMASFFPTQSDLETELACSYLCEDKFAEAKASAESAVSRIEEANGPDCPDLQRPLEILAQTLRKLNQQEAAQKCRDRAIKIAELKHSPVTIEGQFKILREALRAVERKDFEAANQLTRQLLEIYRLQAPPQKDDRYSLNLYCAILNLSRKLADGGHYQQSNKLLSELEIISAKKESSSIAPDFIRVEKTYNTAHEASQKDVSKPIPWPGLGMTNAAVSPVVPSLLPWSQTASAILKVYDAAGETSRAAFVLDNILANKEKVTSKGKPDPGLTEHSKIILMLAAARTRCRENKLSQAFALASEALTIIDSSAAPSPPDLIEYRNEVIELAEAFKDAGASSPRIIEFLQNVSAKLGHRSGSAEPSNRAGAQSTSEIDPYVNRCIAEIFHSDKKDVNALPYARKFIASHKKWADLRAHLLAGEIFEANNLYGEAAHQYLIAGKLEKSFEAITKADKPDHDEELQIIRQLAEARRWDSPQRSVELFEKAAAKTPDTSPDKANLLLTISNIKQRATSPRAREGQFQEQDQLALPRQYAQSAEMNYQADAWRKYLALATLEAKAGLSDEAIEHARRALKLHLRRFDEVLGCDSQGLIPSDGLPQYLAEHGKSDDEIEKLLGEAADRCALVYGENSVPLSAQLQQNFEFFLDRKDWSRALQIYEQLLKTRVRNLDCIGYCVGQDINQIGSKALLLANNGRSEEALKLLNKLLDAQRKALDKDDERIAKTFLSLAKIQYGQKDVQAAETSIWQAIEIYRLYVGDERITTHESGDFLLQLWRETGRAADAEVIDMGRFQICPALLRKFGNDSLVAAADAAGNLPAAKLSADFVDPNMVFSHNRKRPDPNARKAEQIQQWKNEYDEAQRQAAYSMRSASALDALIFLSNEEMNWQVLAYAAAARAKLFEHRIDRSAGRSTTGTTLAGTRLDYYLYAASAYVHLNKQAEAKDWLERAERNLPALTYGEHLQLARAALALDDKSVAKRFAERADSQLKANTALTTPYKTAEAADIWSQLGEPNRAVTATETTTTKATVNSPSGQYQPGPNQWRKLREEDAARLAEKTAQKQKKQMEELESIAIVAEKGNVAKAVELWMRLATNEIRKQQFDQAIEHIKRAINLESTSTIYDEYGRSRFTVEPIFTLSEAGRMDDAVKLLQAHVNEIKSICGSNSAEYTAQLAYLFKLYTMAKDPNQSRQALDELLTVDPRKQELNGRIPGARSQLFQVLSAILKKDSHDQIALDALKKLVAAQRSTYGSDDRTVMTMLKTLASIEASNGNTEMSEELRKEAASIEKLYGNSTLTDPETNGNLRALTKKQPDNPSEDNPSSNDQPALPKKQPPISTFYDIAGVQKYYSWWHQNAPYSEHTIVAAKLLLRNATEEKDWARVHDIAVDQIKALSHSSLLAPQGCILRDSTASRKFDAYKSIIEACVRLGRADEAQQWQSRAVSEAS